MREGNSRLHGKGEAQMVWQWVVSITCASCGDALLRWPYQHDPKAIDAASCRYEMKISAPFVFDSMCWRFEKAYAAALGSNCVGAEP